MSLIKGKNWSRHLHLIPNCLLSPRSMEIVGVVLGNCVYGRTGKLKGKLINKVVYNTKGEKVAIENFEPVKEIISLNFERLSRERWTVLQAISDHNSPWVETKEQWADADLEEYLTS